MNKEKKKLVDMMDIQKDDKVIFFRLREQNGKETQVQMVTSDNISGIEYYGFMALQCDIYRKNVETTNIEVKKL